MLATLSEQNVTASQNLASQNVSASQQSTRGNKTAHSKKADDSRILRNDLNSSTTNRTERSKLLEGASKSAMPSASHNRGSAILNGSRGEAEKSILQDLGATTKCVEENSLKSKEISSVAAGRLDSVKSAPLVKPLCNSEHSKSKETSKSQNTCHSTNPFNNITQNTADASHHGNLTDRTASVHTPTKTNQLNIEPVVRSPAEDVFDFLVGTPPPPPKRHCKSSLFAVSMSSAKLKPVTSNAAVVSNQDEVLAADTDDEED